MLRQMAMAQMMITRPEFLEGSEINDKQPSPEAILNESEWGLWQPILARDFFFGALWTSALLAIFVSG